MQGIEKHQVLWDAYWGETRTIAKSSYPEARPIWDSDPEAGVLVDLPRFQSLMDQSLPIVDFGCGNGTQTPTLARHFRQVIGTDVSADAVRLAAEINGAPNISYETLDALRMEEVRAFHKKTGDVNLYVRTVLHQFSPEERALFGAGLRTLIGERGTMYIIELGASSPAYFGGWIERHGIPQKLQRVISKGITPGPVGRADIEGILPSSDYEVISDGECTIKGMHMRSDKLDAEGMVNGAPWEPPMYFAAVRKRRTKN
jgi:SAM-dependent methyltransferase